ncbi:MAG TPA: penicillin-insensitive murein endopeptidase [Stellaceae bacterium]|nr:penicillin-insensitive murein endopeptidase [Stellaceae bacterium]
MPRAPTETQRAVILVAAFTMAARLASGAAAEDLAAREAAERAALLESLPRDAAQRLFGREARPAAGPAEAIGNYSRGCLEGAVELPADGANWEVMRPSRNRAWGHPALIGFLERLARRLPEFAGWPGLLVGDIAQPRGGPMPGGHESHQIGLDADIWLTPMPPRRLSAAEREEMSAESVVAGDGEDVDRAVWSPRHRRLLEAAARSPRVARIFVNPAIKRALCREAGNDRRWLNKIRPWWGHKTHFHLRLSCPSGDRLCRNQLPPPRGDGCGGQLAWWFTPAGRRPPAGPPRKPVRLADLPHACAALVGGSRIYHPGP